MMWQQIVEFVKKNQGSSFIYLLWCSLHVYFFLVRYPNESAGRRFWPFSEGFSNRRSTYDLSELFIYTVFPILIFIGFRILTKKGEEMQRKLDEELEKAQEEQD